MALNIEDFHNSDPIELLKLEWKILNVGTALCLSTGFLIWVSSPFIAGKNNPSLRYASIFTGLFCGSMAIACSKKLEKIQPLIIAINKAESQAFKHKTASSQYVIEKLYEREAGEILSPPQQLPEDAPPQLPPQATESSAAITKQGTEEISAPAEAAAAEDAEGLPMTREERFQLLRKLVRGKRSKAEMIQKCFGIDTNHPEYSYYQEMLEQILAELKSLDS